MTFYWSSSLTYVVVMPFLSCFVVSLGLVYVWTFGVQLEPPFALVLAWECLALIASES